MTSKQIKFVWGLLHRAGLKEEKEKLVWEFSEGRTTSLNEMNQEETQELINALLGEDKSTSRQKQLRKVFSQMHEMGWELTDGKVDIDRLNAWAVKYSPLHKPVDQYKENELPQLVTAFGKMYQSFLEGL